MISFRFWLLTAALFLHFRVCPAQPLFGHLIVEYDNGTIDFIELQNVPENPDSWLQTFRMSHGVVAAQWDYRLEFKAVPNDPEFKRQWSLPHTGTDRAWKLSTGGVTAAGDTIVVAIIDGGFDIGHSDLKSNIWNNPGEIPDDGVDNDGNGYTDDYYGWNFAAESPVHPIDIHGTSVAGIIGAAGNNGFGVSGINWKVKLMLLTAEKVSDVIKACQYIMHLRNLYHATAGREGALVVVANASLGVSGVFCKDQPVWGGMFDKLGKAGILTAAATANIPANVDETGDMPSTCPSPFLITVLNSDAADQRQASSGFSQNSIDLGAPGVDILTTQPGNIYGYFTGTSAAAPHVSGAVALLYSIPCDNFARMVRQQPQQAALTLRQVILNGTVPSDALSGTCMTGGRLSVAQSMQLLALQCDNANQKAGIHINSLYPNPANSSGIIVVYTAPDTSSVTWYITNAMGQVLKREALTAPNNWPKKQLHVPLEGLPPGPYALSLSLAGKTTTQRFIRL